MLVGARCLLLRLGPASKSGIGMRSDVANWLMDGGVPSMVRNQWRSNYKQYSKATSNFPEGHPWKPWNVQHRPGDNGAAPWMFDLVCDESQRLILAVKICCFGYRCDRNVPKMSRLPWTTQWLHPEHPDDLNSKLESHHECYFKSTVTTLGLCDLHKCMEIPLSTELAWFVIRTDVGRCCHQFQVATGRSPDLRLKWLAQFGCDQNAIKCLRWGEAILSCGMVWLKRHKRHMGCWCLRLR